jgi:hypothetical protein
VLVLSQHTLARDLSPLIIVVDFVFSKTNQMAAMALLNTMPNNTAAATSSDWVMLMRGNCAVCGETVSSEFRFVFVENSLQ